MADGVDPWAYWKAACEAVRKKLPLPPMTDGKPDIGFYWICKIKDGPKLPVAIFYDQDDLIITIDGVAIPQSEHNKTWTICARHPVEYRGVYDVREKTGKWPFELEAPEADQAIGSNSPPADEALTPYEVLVKSLDDVKVWIEANKLDSDAAADSYADKARELQRLKSLVKEMHEAEKAPHWAKCKEIDDKYLPLVREETRTQEAGRATKAIQYLFGRVDAWIEAKREAARKAEADRQAELKRKADEAIAIAKKLQAESPSGQDGHVPSTPLPEAPASPPASPVPPPEPEKYTYGGLAGNRYSGKKKKPTAILDGATPEEILAAQDKLYQHFRDHPDVRETLMKLAQAIVKAKMPAPPGTHVEEV